jgi:hypothetical protein
LRASIIATLRALRQSPNQPAIANLPDFVAIKTYSACADYFREKHPRRWRLKSLLRRRLRQNPRFALWQAEDKRWYASFSGCQENGSEAEEPDASRSVSPARLSEPPAVAGGPTALIATTAHEMGPPATAGGSDKAKLSDTQIKSDESWVSCSSAPVDQ